MLKLAHIIRSDIEQMDAPFSNWPPISEEIDYQVTETIKIADEFVAIKEFSCSRKSGKTIQFVGEDIIYNMSNGKTKAIKQVQLGITTKRKTGSRLMLDSLNCLGHPISYDETIKSKVRLLNRMSKIRVIDRLYGTMSSLHRLSFCLRYL